MLLRCVCLPPLLVTQLSFRSRLISKTTGCWIRWHLSLHPPSALYLDRTSLWLRFVLLTRKLSKTSSPLPSPLLTSPSSRFLPLVRHHNTSPSNWSTYQFYQHSFWTTRFALFGLSMVRLWLSHLTPSKAYRSPPTAGTWS